jgi:predicted O-methyltransferase YrrM
MRRARGPFSRSLFGRCRTRQKARRVPGDDRAGLDILRDYRAGPDQCTCADSDPTHDHCAGTKGCAALHHRRQEPPVLFAQELATLVGRPRSFVVDEEDAVADEDLVPDLDAVADERVALDLAAGADFRAALDLHKRADPGAVTNPAAVKIAERVHDDVLAELGVVYEPVRRVVTGSVSHLEPWEVACGRPYVVRELRWSSRGRANGRDPKKGRYTLAALLARLVRLAAATVEAGPGPVVVTLRAKRRGAKQKLREFGSLVRLVRKRCPRVVVEIGTMHGGTLWAWCQSASSDALLVSIDLPGGAFGGGYSDAEAERLAGYRRPGQTLELIRADSHDPATVAQLRALLGSRTIDLLFIDADHSYEGVARDYEMYAPLVRPGGLIAFHDVLPCRPEDGEVSRFWHEVRARYRYCEFTDPHDLSWRGQWGGIGVLFTE